MAVKRVKKEALIAETILFEAESDSEFESISPSFAYNLIDIISLDIGGNPVTPTVGTFNIFARTDLNGGFKRITERSNYPGKLTGGSGLTDGEAVDAKFIGFPLEFKIIPNGVDVAVSYRVNIKQSSSQVGLTTPIETSGRGCVGVPIFVQDQTTESLDVPFLLDRGTFNLDGDTVRDSRFFDAVTGHNIVVDEIIELADSASFMQTKVLGVVADTIEVDIPVNHVYLSGGTGTRSTDDMRVDGSVTPQVFSILPLAGQAGDMTRVILTIETTQGMDFTKFGDANALTNGCVLRIKRSNGDFRNQLNFKTNGDFIEKCYDHIPLPRSGAGGFGLVFRLTYAGQDKHGVAVRVDGDEDEEWQLVIQDDISVATLGLLKLRMSAAGHELQE